MNLSIFNVFLKNKNIIFKIRRSKVTDYAALKTSINLKRHDPYQNLSSIYDYFSAFLAVAFMCMRVGILGRKPDFVACEKQRHRPACASARFEQHLCYSLAVKSAL